MAAKTLSRIPAEKQLNQFEKDADEIGKEISKVLMMVDLLDYTETMAMKIRIQIDLLIKKLNKLDVKYIGRFIPVAYAEAREASAVALEVLGKKKQPTFNNSIHQFAIMERKKEALGFLWKANGSIRQFTETYLYLSRRVADGLKQLQLTEFGGLDASDEAFLLDRITDAVEAGTSRQVAAKRIRDFFQMKIGDGSLLNINGRYYRIGPYSKLVARTEMRRAQSDAVKNASKQYNSDLVEVSDHGTLTDICKPYEGNIYSISGNSQKYPYLDTDPPYHPNCMHYLIPTSAEAIDFEGGFQ